MLCQRDVSLGCNGLLGERQCQGISFERTSIVPIQIPRKLVQHDYFSESAMRIRSPRKEFGAHGRVMQRARAIGYQLIKRRIYLPLLCRLDLVKPELQN